MKAKLKEELLKAKQGKYAVPAFNFDNLEMMKGIIEAAEAEKSPVILMVTESAAKYMGLDYVFAFSLTAAIKATVPVVLHWDHGFDISLIKRAIDAGFSSVMLDSSLKPFAENVKETQEIVAYARQKGVEVESEIGHVGGKEDDRNSSSKGYTDVQEAVEFDKQTQIDALAVAIGTSHGLFSGEIKLQFELLAELEKNIKTPLVLHGSSQVPLEDLQKAIDLGITKINIGTDLKMACAEGIKAWFKENPNGFDARKYGRNGVDFVKAEAIKKIRAFRSNNKA
ncbi:fructose/tagatose bisphosphate aldolase, class II [Spiroplasma clarkii]|uniref:Tagatose 1,6-diphosphate aldolase GatY/KbaY n=1 Tax=Spiroplasma clarkii TaxID=2139 RepID=A0A1Y0KZT3_9MOLU|nr:class II fructose-bisphosphate aldolase [Spiroplasma clarkii]ARU90978.1 fructose/tagatose bisphosphate aldolase, class II [Spiroplasma clarkii]ATX70420.1 tagatose 1,6-diphosphate aldolase GatY/KbaY [Spiroplasma clarkii]